AWTIATQEREPLHANTLGVGEMRLAAMGRDEKGIIIGLGGSATNDGGFGMARPFGFRFLNKDGGELTNLVSDLRDLEHISPPRDLTLPHMTAATDVLNPLLGERGATRTFGPQKGVTPDQLTLLEEALTRLADIAARDL